MPVNSLDTVDPSSGKYVYGDKVFLHFCQNLHHQCGYRKHESENKCATFTTGVDIGNTHSRYTQKFMRHDSEVRTMSRVAHNLTRPNFSMNELVIQPVTNLFHNTLRDETGLSVSDHQAAFIVTDTISSTSPESNFLQLPFPFKTITYDFQLNEVSFIRTQEGSL